MADHRDCIFGNCSFLADWGTLRFLSRWCSSFSEGKFPQALSRGSPGMRRINPNYCPFFSSQSFTTSGIGMVVFLENVDWLRRSLEGGWSVLLESSANPETMLRGHWHRRKSWHCYGGGSPFVGWGPAAGGAGFRGIQLEIHCEEANKWPWQWWLRVNHTEQ